MEKLSMLLEATVTSLCFLMIPLSLGVYEGICICICIALLFHLLLKGKRRSCCIHFLFNHLSKLNATGWQ